MRIKSIHWNVLPTLKLETFEFLDNYRLLCSLQAWAVVLQLMGLVPPCGEKAHKCWVGPPEEGRVFGSILLETLSRKVPSSALTWNTCAHPSSRTRKVSENKAIQSHLKQCLRDRTIPKFQNRLMILNLGFKGHPWFAFMFPNSMSLSLLPLLWM